MNLWFLLYQKLNKTNDHIIRVQNNHLNFFKFFFNHLKIVLEMEEDKEETKSKIKKTIKKKINLKVINAFVD